MPVGLLFWMIMIILLFFGGGWGYTNQGNRWGIGIGAITYVLFFLLGWKVFGFILQ